ncbi:hypothetical protein NOR_02121 [Metarhizium rileyi]|uniref:Uncharacterized protein n=1 Tax=Metarhizium rileyi (strain RCEF 4871) TaxID=1649241 RepID=A0A167H901_METRR|nr:hypothetical protein NOR_02121 [Metarhizium rileyi RCEF 4871]
MGFRRFSVASVARAHAVSPSKPRATRLGGEETGSLDGRKVGPDLPQQFVAARTFLTSLWVSGGLRSTPYSWGSLTCESKPLPDDGSACGWERYDLDRLKRTRNSAMKTAQMTSIGRCGPVATLQLAVGPTGLVVLWWVQQQLPSLAFNAPQENVWLAYRSQAKVAQPGSAERDQVSA